VVDAVRFFIRRWKANLKTVVGPLGFYQHAEQTWPWVGEVDNPNWRQQWTGKLVYDEDGEVARTSCQGQCGSNTPNASIKVDGLQAQTLTSPWLEALGAFFLAWVRMALPFLEKSQ